MDNSINYNITPNKVGGGGGEEQELPSQNGSGNGPDQGHIQLPINLRHH